MGKVLIIMVIARQRYFCVYPHFAPRGNGVLAFDDPFFVVTHTCDIILDANREIWALKSYFVF